MMELSDSEYILSALGNAFYSGLSLEQVYLAACIANDSPTPGIDFDRAIEGSILLKETLDNV